MLRTLNKEVPNHIGEQVTIKGWLHVLRSLGKLNFLLVRDRTGLVQIVIEDKDTLMQIKDLQVGSVIAVTGTVQEAPQTELGAEIINPVFEVITAVTDPMPVEINKEELKAHLDTILDYRPLTLRHEQYRAIFKIQATLVRAYREFLTQHGFTEFFGPNIIGASSEGGSELFEVKYFDNKAMLSQSAQLYKQMMVGVYERVFALMKCFRAEKSNTRRHLTEATQFEFEMGFIEDVSDVMDMLEEIVKYMIEAVSSECKNELKVLGADLASAPKEVAFPRITFKEALELVYQRTGVDERNENDLSPFAEKELCTYAKEEFGTDFVFVTQFLREKTAFYAHPNAEDPTVTNYFDLLCREIEISSGGQRIHEHDMLVESLKAKQLDPKNFEDYLSIFKYGMPPHGGFGMGMERFTMMALGLENIRMSTLFPSDPKRVAGVKLAEKIYTGAELKTEILRRFEEAGIQYRLLEHEATPTSEDSARVRGTKMSEGVKAIILRDKKTKENIMACVPSDQKLDIRRLNELTNRKLEFEKPEIIRERFGIEVGGVPPFGNLMGIPVYYSEDLKNERNAAFNIASQKESVLMNMQDLFSSVEPLWF